MGRNREQLRLCRTVTQPVYDGGEKETDCIGRQAYGVETKPVEVDLWVLECLADPTPGKLLVPSGVAIILESRENVFPFPGSEELCSCGVVMDEEVRSNRRDDSQ